MHLFLKLVLYGSLLFWGQKLTLIINKTGKYIKQRYADFLHTVFPKQIQISFPKLLLFEMQYHHVPFQTTALLCCSRTTVSFIFLSEMSLTVSSSLSLLPCIQHMQSPNHRHSSIISPQPYCVYFLLYPHCDSNTEFITFCQNHPGIFLLQPLVLPSSPALYPCYKLKPK